KALAAEARVLLRLVAPKLVVDVQGGDPVAERPERMPQAGRVGAARDEAEDLARGRDQVVLTDVLFDARAEDSGLHRRHLRGLSDRAALLQERLDVAAAPLQRGLGLHEHLAGEVRETVGTVHLVTRLLALLLGQD